MHGTNRIERMQGAQAILVICTKQNIYLNGNAKYNLNNLYIKLNLLKVRNE